MFNLVRTFYLITQASHKNMVTVIRTCAGGHQATDKGIARRQGGARRRFCAPLMRTRWAARGGVRRVVASGLCEERGGRNRLNRAGTAREEHARDRGLPRSNGCSAGSH